MKHIEPPSSLFRWILCDDFGISFNKHPPRSRADGNALTIVEDNGIALDTLDVLRVYEKSLMAENEAITFKLFADVLQTAADRDLLFIRK